VLEWEEQWQVEVLQMFTAGKMATLSTLKELPVQPTLEDTSTWAQPITGPS